MGLSEHPRVTGNKVNIYPRLKPEDVQWGYDRLNEALEGQWAQLNEDNEINVPLPWESIFDNGYLL